MKNVLHVCVLLLCTFYLQSQNSIKPADLVSDAENFASATEIQTFENAAEIPAKFQKRIQNELQNAKILQPIQTQVDKLMSGTESFVEVNLPKVNAANSITLKLVQVEVLHKDFQVTTSDGARISDINVGKHYRGIIKGEYESLASLSVLPDGELMAVIRSETEGTYVLGKLKNDSNGKHIFYNTKDMLIEDHLQCSVIDDGIPYTKAEISEAAGLRSLDDCVRIFIDVDYDIYQNKGSVSNATAFATGIFNQSATFYADEQVNQLLSEVNVWTSNSPYSGSSASAYLSDFKAEYNGFNGDLAHLITTSVGGGIAAGFSGICNSNPDFSMCVSGINSSYEEVPTYSWTVDVFAHELGHLHGSRHTHACVWNGNGTQIDDCGNKYFYDRGQTPEGNACYNPGNPIIPLGGGTIMSYCHLNSVGKDFNQGFHSQVANVIRGQVSAGSCLTSCDSGGGGDDPYCTSQGNNTNYEYIESVSVGDLNNNSGNDGGYANFISQSANTSAGATVSVSLTPGFASGSYTEYWRIYIDYNKDGDFSDIGEQVFSNNGSSTVSGSFTIPSSIAPVETRMRISMKYNGYAAPCESFSYGEVEDYTINIEEGTSSCTDLTISVTTDNYPHETSWELKNSSGSTIASGGNYNSRNTTYTWDDCLNDGCYTFTIYDSYGDGICCRYGFGEYEVTSGSTTIVSGGSFRSSETTNFCLPLGASQPPVTSQSAVIANSDFVSVYPQPASQSLFVEYESKSDSEIEISFSGINGKQLRSFRQNVHSGKNQFEVITSDFESGVYIMSIQTGENQIVEKIIIGNNN